MNNGKQAFSYDTHASTDECKQNWLRTQILRKESICIRGNRRLHLISTPKVFQRPVCLRPDTALKVLTLANRLSSRLIRLRGLSDGFDISESDLVFNSPAKAWRLTVLDPSNRGIEFGEGLRC